MGPDRVTEGCRLQPVALAEQDARTIMAWRNDPTTRAASFDTAHRSWPEFWDEFRKRYATAGMPTPHFLICDGIPVAYLRFDPPRTGPEDGTAEISINVAPAERGKGYGRLALRLADDLLAANGIARIHALVKEDNTVSLRLFAAAGYRETGRDRIDVPGRGQPVAAVHFVRDLETAAAERKAGTGH